MHRGAHHCAGREDLTLHQVVAVVSRVGNGSVHDKGCVNASENRKRDFPCCMYPGSSTHGTECFEGTNAPSMCTW